MFQPGISGNTRGRPSGSLGGRAQALAALDRMLSKECNQQALFDALEKEFQADPARFFRNVVVPLIPRSTREALPPDAFDDWLPMDRTPPSDPPPVLEPYVPPPPRTYPPPPVKGSLSDIQGNQPSVLRPQPSVFRPQSSFLRLPTSVLRSLLPRFHSPLSNLKSLISNLILRPLSSFLMSALRPPASVLNLPFPSSRLSFACYLLLLIPFALKPDPMPHPTRALVNAASDRLSRIVHTAGVAVKGLAVSDTLPCQPARKDTCYIQMNGGDPVLLSAARPLQTLKRSHVSNSRNVLFLSSTARPLGGRANPAHCCYSLLLIPHSASFNLEPFQGGATRKCALPSCASSKFPPTNELPPSQKCGSIQPQPPVP